MKIRNASKAEPAPPGSNPDSEPARGGPDKVKRILVPVDLSEASLRVLDYALALAGTFQATVIVLHVVEPAAHPGNYLTTPATVDETNQNLLEASRERLGALTRKRFNQGVAVETLVRMGHAPAEIVDTAKAMAADWIVLATCGDSELKQSPIGSTAERVVHSASCPVLTVRLARRSA